MELTSPEALGLSSARLSRIGDHFNDYVDNGRLPGYTVMVSRRGQPAFWIDPLEELIVIFITQLMPSAAYAIRRELRVLVYQSIVNLTQSRIRATDSAMIKE